MTVQWFNSADHDDALMQVINFGCSYSNADYVTATDFLDGEICYLTYWDSVLTTQQKSDLTEGVIKPGDLSTTPTHLKGMIGTQGGGGDVGTDYTLFGSPTITATDPWEVTTYNLTAVGGDNNIDQFETTVALTHDFPNALTICTINGVDHADLLSGAAGSETIDYIRRTADIIEATQCYVIIGDGIEENTSLLITANTTHPYDLPYAVVNTNSICKSLKLTGNSGYACAKVTTNPTDGTLTTSGSWLSGDVGNHYSADAGYTGTDTIVLEVYDPDESTTKTQSFTVTLTIA